LDTARTVLEEGLSVPGAVNLATVAMLVPMKRNVPTATHPSARNAQSGCWEKTVQRIKAERGITFMEVRRIAVAESEGRTVQGCRTAAAVVASSNSSTRRAAHSTRSIAIQTDLTWPDEQDAPTNLPIVSTTTNQTSNSSSLTVGRGGGTARGGSAAGRKPSEQPVCKGNYLRRFCKASGQTDPQYPQGPEAEDQATSRW